MVSALRTVLIGSAAVVAARPLWCADRRQQLAHAATLRAMDLEQIPARGHRSSLNRAGCTRGTAWLLDGARGAQEPDNSAAAYVEAVSQEIAAVLTYAPETSLDDLARRAARVAGSDGCQAALALTRREGTRISHVVIGDVAVLVSQPGGSVSCIQDMRINEVAGPQRAAWATAAACGRSDVGVLQKQLEDEETRWRNTPGGFWVIEPGRTDAVDHALTGSTLSNDPVVLATSGALLNMGADELYWQATGPRGSARGATLTAWQVAAGAADVAVAVF